MNIYQKLVEVRKVVTYLKKENSGAQYNYVSSSQVLANVRDKMDELGLLLVPKVVGHNVLTETIEFEYQGKPKKTTTYFTELDVIYTWINTEKPEEQIECPWYGQGVDTAGEKGVGKALTYAEKYFMLKFFNIATDKDDPDAFQRKHDDEPKQQQGQQRQQNQQQGQVKLLSSAQKNLINKLFTDKNVNPDQQKALLKEKLNKESIDKLTPGEASKLIEYLQKAS